MIISRTPVRISFFGGGTDYPEYFERSPCAILGTTIDKYTYVTINKGSPFFDHRIRVSYSKAELVDSIDEIQHPSVRETLKFLKLDDYLDIHIFADLPAKTGLGSSSSFTVGFLNACYAYMGIFASKEKLANDAIHIEQKLLRENVGIQDQIHAAYGGLNVIQADITGFHVNPIIISREKKVLLENSLMLFYTRMTRFATEVLQEQMIKTKTLALDDYLSVMANQVATAQTILNQDTDSTLLFEFGSLLHEGWLLKKKLSTQISNPQIDQYYQTALHAGAIGGKITGAGGGGFLLLIVPPHQKDQVRQALPHLLEVQFALESHGSTIIYSFDSPHYQTGKSSKKGMECPKIERFLSPAVLDTSDPI